MSDQTSSCPDGSCPRTDGESAAGDPPVSRSVQQLVADFSFICEELDNWTDEPLDEPTLQLAYSMLQTAYQRENGPGHALAGLREVLLRAVQSSCQAAAADDAQDEDPVAPVPAAAPATNGAAAPA